MMEVLVEQHFFDHFYMEHNEIAVRAIVRNFEAYKCADKRISLLGVMA